MCVTLSLFDTKPYEVAAAVHEAIAARGRGPVAISYGNAIFRLYYDGDYRRVFSTVSDAYWIIHILGGGSHVSVNYFGCYNAYDLKLVTTIITELSKNRRNR